MNRAKFNFGLYIILPYFSAPKMSSIALPDFFFLDLDFLTFVVVSFAGSSLSTSSGSLVRFEGFFSVLDGVDNSSFSFTGSIARRIGTPKSLFMSSGIFAVNEVALFRFTEGSRRGSNGNGMMTLFVCASAARRTVPRVENCPSATTVEKALCIH